MGRSGSEQVLDEARPFGQPVAPPDGAVLEGVDLNSTSQIQAVTGPNPVVSVHLDHSEVPFQQTNLRSVLLEPKPRWAWHRITDRIGRWPILLLIGLLFFAVVFTLFISRNSQTLSDDFDSRVAQAVTDSPSDSPPASDEPAVGLNVAGLAGEEDADSGRSTGVAGDFGPIEYYAGQLVESEAELSADITWVTTTTAAPTSTSTTNPESSTTTPESTTTTSSTTTTTTTTTTSPEPVLVVAVSPGRPAGQEPERITSETVVLQAEGQEGRLGYRFSLYVQNEASGQWDLRQQTSWRARPRIRVDLESYDGQSVRWTVAVRQRDGVESPETEPLYFLVGDDEPEVVDPEVGNGGFEGIEMGGEVWVMQPAGSVAAWSSSNGVIEVWTNDFDPTVQAASGTKFIELNSTGPSTIRQVVDVSPGSLIGWSLAHRSRQQNNEAIEVRLRPVDGREPWLGPYSAPLGSWVRHSGTYRVPDGVTQIEFAVRSATGGSIANFVDDVRVGLTE